MLQKLYADYMQTICKDIVYSNLYPYANVAYVAILYLPIVLTVTHFDLTIHMREARDAYSSGTNDSTFYTKALY